VSATERDSWDLEPTAEPPSVRAAVTENERWVTTRDGWLAAESVGEDLRNTFATEDLEPLRQRLTSRVFLTLAVIALAVGAIVAFI
jgi:hypothetical protein